MPDRPNRLPLSPHQRRSILRALMQKHAARCTRCGVAVGMAWALIRAGWVLRHSEGLLVSPAGDVLALATIEHVRPLCRGGDHSAENLTLYCRDCNTQVSNGAPREL